MEQAEQAAQQVIQEGAAEQPIEGSQMQEPLTEGPESALPQQPVVQDWAPLEGLLRSRYGAQDAVGWAQALEQDAALGSDITARAAKATVFRGAMGEYVRLLSEADALRRQYPGFDLAALCEDKRFGALLQAGESMEAAYRSMHQEEMLRMAVRETARAAERMLLKDRPAEGAMQTGSTAMTRSDPANMTRAQREAIAKRVLKGEKVIL